MPPLRIGIAGIGRMGQRHAMNLAHRTMGHTRGGLQPGLQAAEWARDKLNGKPLYGDYKIPCAPEMMRYLVTRLRCMPNKSSRDCRRASSVSEKPLALTLPDCLKVEREAAKFPNHKVMIGFVRRFDPSYRDAYEKVKAGLIGGRSWVRSQTADQNDPSGFFCALPRAARRPCST